GCASGAEPSSRRFDHRPARWPRRETASRSFGDRARVAAHPRRPPCPSPASRATRRAGRRARLRALQREHRLITPADVGPAPAPADDQARRTDRVPGGTIALAVLVTAWIVVLVTYLRHRTVWSSD